MDNIATNVALDPGEDGLLKFSGQGALAAVQPSLQGVDDLNVKVADNTTSGTEFKTRPDLPVNLTKNLNGGLESRLSSGGENTNGLRSQRENTVHGHEEAVLSSNADSLGKKEAELSKVSDIELLDITLTPRQQFLLERSLEVGTRAVLKPGSKLLAVLEVNGASLATKSTTAESCSSLGADATKDVCRGLAVKKIFNGVD